MEQTEITEIVTRTGRLVADHYVFPEVAVRLDALLGERLAGGRYASADGPQALAAAVTADLQSLNGDLHLRLVHHDGGVPDLPSDAMLTEMFTREAHRSMGGVARVERLPGNVGHVVLSPILYPAPVVGEVVTAAMRMVARTEVLILDVRENRGGAPETVALLCGHLFDEPVHLTSMLLRDGDRAIQSWTPAYLSGSRFGGTKPVHVLTSASTFSGGEELAYDLQQLGRATVVGERTRGGAHPRTGFRVHPHLEVTVPTGRAVNPVSGTNWEGTGVAPDVEVPAAQALAVAHRRALEHVRAHSADPETVAEAGRALGTTEAA